MVGLRSDGLRFLSWVSTATVRRATLVVPDVESSGEVVGPHTGEGDSAEIPTSGELVPLARPASSLSAARAEPWKFR